MTGRKNGFTQICPLQICRKNITTEEETSDCSGGRGGTNGLPMMLSVKYYHPETNT